MVSPRLLPNGTYKIVKSVNSPVMRKEAFLPYYGEDKCGKDEQMGGYDRCPRTEKNARDVSSSYVEKQLTGSCKRRTCSSNSEIIAIDDDSDEDARAI